MKKSCDCWVGILNNDEQSEINNLYEKSIKGRLLARARHSKKMNKLLGHGQIFKPMDYINRRKSLSLLFDFCPDCYEKINWRKIRQEIKEVS